MTESKPFYTRLSNDTRQGKDGIAQWCRGRWTVDVDELTIQQRPDFPGAEEIVFRGAKIEWLRVDDARRLVAEGVITLVDDPCHACQGTGRA
jgi:hypothetical protein